jgi:hypothetical protein
MIAVTDRNMAGQPPKSLEPRESPTAVAAQPARRVDIRA